MTEPDLHTTFHRIARAYQQSPGGPPVADEASRRRLTALYKQATRGDIQGEYPTFFKFRDRARFEAWHKLRGTPTEEAMQQYVDLAHELGYRDPGPSPVPWISDETWARTESWAPADGERYPCIDEPHILTAKEHETERAPTIAATDKVSLPPDGTPEELANILQNQSPKTFYLRLFAPRWPRCCDRATCLVGFHNHDEVFTPVLPQTYLIGSSPSAKPYGDTLLTGELALYHCLVCWSVFLGDKAA